MRRPLVETKADIIPYAWMTVFAGIVFATSFASSEHEGRRAFFRQLSVPYFLLTIPIFAWWAIRLRKKGWL